MNDYVVSVDQSTQGTKALLFDSTGKLLQRADRKHRQIINEKGWVEHDPEEIYSNTVAAVRDVLEKSGIDPGAVQCFGISNQRETAMAWNRKTGKPVYNAVVWQCARGEAICERIDAEGYADEIQAATGLPLSPYFSAAKLAWILENVTEAKEAAESGNLCCGTMDSWLVWKLTGGREFRTDYSNASRTQLFNITSLKWDDHLCRIFGIPRQSLAELTDSDGLFGMTDFDGLLPHAIPIHGVLGDSHGALFGQGCLKKGMMKTTYGTGSSIMMNIGEKPIFAHNGIVTSLAWKMNGTVQYVLEGNINYTGSVISWLKDQVGLIQDVVQPVQLAEEANPADHTYLVPAFSGLGAPYWRSDVSAAFCGMTRTTGKAELVRAAVASIAYQIADIVFLMKEASGAEEMELRVDGGPTENRWLMQFQSDILQSDVHVPQAQELSGIGAAYAAGIGAEVFDADSVFSGMKYSTFSPKMGKTEQSEKYQGWKNAVRMVLQTEKERKN